MHRRVSRTVNKPTNYFYKVQIEESVLLTAPMQCIDFLHWKTLRCWSNGHKRRNDLEWKHEVLLSLSNTANLSVSNTVTSTLYVYLMLKLALLNCKLRNKEDSKHAVRLFWRPRQSMNHYFYCRFFSGSNATNRKLPFDVQKQN